MSDFRLYKKFYVIKNDQVANTQTYTLLNPYFISANSYIAGTGATESGAIIETNIQISQESQGVYYANLDPSLYSVDNIYDLVWFVEYNVGASLKKVSTRFKIANSTSKIIHQLEAELVSQVLEIEILNQSISFEIN